MLPGVVVILMGTDSAGAAVIGRTIAAELDWPLVEGEDPRALHAFASTAIGRRQHLLAATVPLTEAGRQTVRGELFGVRFVDLAEHPAGASAILGVMRREFGL
jgi:hypothetical protein